MQAGAEVDVAGPAVLASPYDDRLLVRELDEFDIPFDEFRKLMWVCAPRKVTVRNSGKAHARMIVFQVGHVSGPILLLKEGEKDGAPKHS